MADKVKETPGPWKALLDPGWGWCVKAGKKYLAFKLTEADAKIMAASWEMLQALERAEKALFVESVGEKLQASEQAKAAISKARG
jgi:hypothetical protein